MDNGLRSIYDITGIRPFTTSQTVIEKHTPRSLSYFQSLLKPKVGYEVIRKGNF